MGIAERAVDRSLAKARIRGEEDVRALIEAGLTLMRRQGVERLTVADVLAQAHRSTRAFYRHFASKDEFVLAIYEYDARGSLSRLHERVSRASSVRVAITTWIDMILRLGYDQSLVLRTRVLADEAKRLQGVYAAEFEAIRREQLAPLIEALQRGLGDGTLPHTDPEQDARSMHAVVWALVEDRLHGNGYETLDEARSHALRFCLPALGLKANP